jgi:hypothetical protein
LAAAEPARCGAVVEGLGRWLAIERDVTVKGQKTVGQGK